MVKLATARDGRLYGTRRSRNRWEYVNAGLYVLATILLMGGLVAQMSSRDAKSGLAVLCIGLLFLTFVNVHDLLAHMAAIDYRLALLGSDNQLALVEIFVPFVQALGSILTLLGIVIFLVQAEKGYDLGYLEKHALNLLIAGPVLWVIGSIHNSCQIYERANGHVQILQKSIQIPFLMGSLLFLVGGILNRHDGHVGSLIYHGIKLLGKSWVWLSISGSVLFFIGGLMNLVKVFRMQQMDGLRLEKLRGGVQERLNREREGQIPLILEDHRRRRQIEESQTRSFPTLSPNKDALLSGKS